MLQHMINSFRRLSPGLLTMLPLHRAVGAALSLEGINRTGPQLLNRPNVRGRFTNLIRLPSCLLVPAAIVNNLGA